MGINARSALDPRWNKHHIKAVRSFMVAEIRVIRKDPNAVRTYDQATKTWNSNGFTTVFVGPARVQPYGIIGDQVVAQDTTGRRLMRVQIEEKVTGIQLDDMIEIVSAEYDPELVNFSLEVRGTIGSSNSWVTELVCEANLKFSPPVFVPGVGYGSDVFNSGIYGG